MAPAAMLDFLISEMYEGTSVSGTSVLVSEPDFTQSLAQGYNRVPTS